MSGHLFHPRNGTILLPDEKENASCKFRLDRSEYFESLHYGSCTYLLELGMKPTEDLVCYDLKLCSRLLSRPWGSGELFSPANSLPLSTTLSRSLKLVTGGRAADVLISYSSMPRRPLELRNHRKQHLFLLESMRGQKASPMKWCMLLLWTQHVLWAIFVKDKGYHRLGHITRSAFFYGRIALGIDPQDWNFCLEIVMNKWPPIGLFAPGVSHGRR